jgi:hypothetical protein
MSKKPTPRPRHPPKGGHRFHAAGIKDDYNLGATTPRQGA